MIESFKEIFTGLERAHGVTKVGQSNGDGTKVQGKSFIKREPVTDELWRKHLQGTDSLGITPQGTASNAHIIVYQSPNRSETTDSEWRTVVSGSTGLNPSSSSVIRKAGGNNADVTAPSSWNWPSKGSALEYYRSSSPEGYIDLEFSIAYLIILFKIFKLINWTNYKLNIYLTFIKCIQKKFTFL